MARWALPAFVALAIGFVGTAAEATDTTRPNVVFILADDLGIGDVKCYEGDRCQIETPGFDRLAAEGVKFTDAHVVASICVPSRLAIMTGRYPWRFDPPRPDGQWAYLRPRMDADRFTLGDLMSEAGYATAYIGKWHLGTEMVTLTGEVQGVGNVDYGQPLRIGPGDYGFALTFILPGSLDMFPYAFIRDHRFVGEVTATKGWSAFNRQGPAAEDFEDITVLDTFSTEAEQFLAAVAAEAEPRPFFLYLALTSPHTPISPRPEFEGRSALGLYGDFVMETDDCIVRVLDALDRHGMADNTLVIATSDHGPAAYAGNIREATPGQLEALVEKGHDANLDYRGYKFSIYEGGLRVPFVARWPALAPAGVDCDELLGLQDLMATLADVMDVDLPEDAGVDSISWLPLLEDPTGGPQRTSMILASSQAFAFRQGNWKLIFDPGSGCPGKYGNRPTAVEAWDAALDPDLRIPGPEALREPPFVQLYDLRKDPGESNNYAEIFPPRREKMLQAFLDEIDATANDREIDPVRGPSRATLEEVRRLRAARGQP